MNINTIELIKNDGSIFETLSGSSPNNTPKKHHSGEQAINSFILLIRICLLNLKYI